MQYRKGPLVKKIPAVFEHHGDRRIDEYSWLQERSDPEVLSHLRKENAFSERYMRGEKRLQQKLYREIRGRIRENDSSVPIESGPYLYYVRFEKGKEYAIHCRRKGKRGIEEILLDENVLARGKKFFSLGLYEVSPDHSKLAYSVDPEGAERFTLYVKDLHSDLLLEERIDEVGDAIFAEDERHLLYTKENHPHPPRVVYLHTLGTSHAQDRVVYEEEDLQWYVGLGKTRDRKFILIHAGNFDTTEIRSLPAAQPEVRPQLLRKRKKGIRYFMEHYGDDFYIMTNDRAVNYKIMVTPVRSASSRKSWRTWLPHDTERALVGLYVYRDFFAILLREDGAEQVYIAEPKTAALRKVELPEREHVVALSADIEHESPYIRISYQSLITPRTVYDYYPVGGRLVLRKRTKVPRWDPRKWVSKRLFAHKGGVRVPITIAHKKAGKGPMPLLLEAYGSYGISLDPYFSLAKISLLERGFAIAIAHPRGGGERGWQWHKAAKLLTKHRTYQDVIACAKHLIADRYTTKQQLSLVGGSAGGMMVGAVLNVEPKLFGAAIAYVPAADVLTSSFDESLGGTRLHFDETGDPRERRMYFYLKRWSPYEAVRRAEYPPLLTRASMHDIRTPYWEAAKWVARLRERSTSKNPVLLKVEMKAGHGGRSGRFQWVKERAFDYAFLIEHLSSRKYNS